MIGLLWLAAAAALASAPAGDWVHANVSSSAQALVAGDFDGDGFDDLLVETRTGGVDVYAGSANGLPVQPTDSLAISFVDPHVLDADGDGFDDLLITSGAGPGVQVYFGSASGLVTSWSQVVLFTSWFYEVATGDVNGDGYDDLAVSLDNAGNGRIVLWWPGSAGGLTQRPGASWSGGQVFGVRDLAMTDADGDGYDDIVVGGGSYNTAELKVYRGGAQGPSAAAWSTVNGPNGFGDFGDRLVGGLDLDGDGFEDLVSTIYDSYNAVYSYAVVRGGAAGLRPAVVTRGVENSVPAMRPLRDVDGDGDDELVAGMSAYDTGGQYNRGVVAVLKLDPGTGRFTMPVAGDFALGSAAEQYCGTAVVGGDFDGTGDTDFGASSPNVAGGGRIDLFYDVP